MILCSPYEVLRSGRCGQAHAGRSQSHEPVTSADLQGHDDQSLLCTYLNRGRPHPPVGLKTSQSSVRRFHPGLLSRLLA
jgi:hypothetical protein